jgi:hypothetical protein
MGLDKRSEIATRPRYKQAAPLTWRVAYRGARPLADLSPDAPGHGL